MIQLVFLTFRLNLHALFDTYLDEALNSLTRVSRNDAVEGLTILLDGLSTSHICRIDLYEKILPRLSHMKTHRLWQNTSLQLARMYLDSSDAKYESSLQNLLQEMKSVSQSFSYLLDIYAVEILLLTREWKGRWTILRLKPILNCCPLEGAVGSPGTIATIREAAGKVFLSQGQFPQAYTELFEAFRAYSSSGNARASQVLQYAIIANILSLSTINPFDSREARAYLDDPGVGNMYDLRIAYESNKLGSLTSDDTFIQRFSEDVRATMQRKKLECIVKAYSSISLEKIGYILQTRTADETMRLVMQVVGSEMRISNGMLISHNEDELEELILIKEYAFELKEDLEKVQ